MSRSAADATRFTATGPFARSKPSSPSSTPYRLPDYLYPHSHPTEEGTNSNQAQQQRDRPPRSHSPPHSPRPQHQESAREKVERLRAQARAARMAEAMTPLDRLIIAGRNVANKTHKFTVYSLLAASGLFSPPAALAQPPFDSPATSSLASA